MARRVPMDLGPHSKTDARTQFAALCYRSRNESLKLLLVTSRRLRRWVLPKGWPVDGLTPAETAMREAFEEAGVSGFIEERCIGHYSYRKVLSGNFSIPCIVAVFPVEVKVLKDSFPENGQRHRKWFTRKKAAAAVSENELKKIILNFNPNHFEGSRK
ncbi:MAG: NUDIX hydrolase [Albidovulum sp.]|nr:NUDIX hydrolase [Albidovulum sp.]MDE0532849.1 NUDIX hydrolase [Albidovulum sp.]